MSIRVVSCRKGGTPIRSGEIPIDISRTSIFGNPFPLEKESDRDNVIELYRLYLHEQRKANTEVWKAVKEIARRVRNGENIALVCWCSPKACHGDVIVNAVLAINENYYQSNRGDVN